MRANSAAPYVSTRRYYDLVTGAPLRTGSRYTMHPRRYLDSGGAAPREIAVMVHGMRNNPADAQKKFAIARRRLRGLGYSHPVVGYSYDSNVRGADSAGTAARALRVANTIAARNGRHLAMFVSDVGRAWPRTRVRLMGHSLGSVVIAGALRHLASRSAGAGAVRSVHLFGASLGAREIALPGLRSAVRRVVSGRLVNCYCPDDEVLGAEPASPRRGAPIGLGGVPTGRARPPHYIQRRLRPRNHRFASYAAALGSFP